MGATTITEPQGKNVAIPSLRFRSLCCGFWLVPSLRVPEATKARATIRGTQGNQPRQGRSDSLVVDSVPSVVVAGSFPLCEFQKQPRQRQPSEERKASRQERCTNGSNRHHRTDNTNGNPFATVDAFGNDNQPRAKALLFPSCGFRSLCEFQSNQGKGVPAMGATTITEPQ